MQAGSNHERFWKWRLMQDCAARGNSRVCSQGDPLERERGCEYAFRRLQHSRVFSETAKRFSFSPTVTIPELKVTGVHYNGDEADRFGLFQVADN
jgi:hypothetical protein